MTRRKLVMGQRSQEEGNNSTMWELPTHWTAAQALAVFEVLDDLRDLVVDTIRRRFSRPRAGTALSQRHPRQQVLMMGMYRSRSAMADSGHSLGAFGRQVCSGCGP